MQAIILAAGRGKRLDVMTQALPKSLIKIKGQTIIERTLSSLPQVVDEVIIVVGYLGQKIKKHINKSYGGIKIKYAEQALLEGTAGALWSAKSLLEDNKFLVLSGDDIYDQKEFELLSRHDLAMGLTKGLPPNSSFYTIEVDRSGFISSYRRPTSEEARSGIIMASGAYVINRSVFSYKPVLLSNGEYGLPQTIFAMSKDYPVRGVFMKKWVPINHPEDIKKAERVL